MNHMNQWNQWGPQQAQQIPVHNPYQASSWQTTTPYQAFQPGAGSLQMQNQGGFYSGVLQPHVDVFETSSDIVIACELPSANPNDINLLVNDDSVTVSANAFWATGTPSSFYRTISLPTTIRSEQSVATYSNGLLEIRMPKSEQSRRRLRVNVNR